jgi:hypothetical protein
MERKVMLRKTALIIKSAFPKSATAFAKTKEKVLSWQHGDRYLGNVFSNIYRKNCWNCPESRSGRCSTVEATGLVRQQLPPLLKRLGVKVLLDAPCGDFNWMQRTELNLDKYIGADIVLDLIEINKKVHSKEGREFIVLDITKDEIPTVDLIFCRDCLIHLSLNYITAAISNFKKSRSKYLLTTTFTLTPENKDILTGDCRFINLQIEPFNFPEPLELIIEEPEHGKSLALWLIEAL